MRSPRRPAAWSLAGLVAGGSALVVATWVVAQLSWQARLRALEAEVTFLRRTRQVDVPRLLNDLERFVAPADDRLAWEDLKQRHRTLEREHRAALQTLAALRRSRRLEDRFRLGSGSSRDLLEGKVRLRVESVEATEARVALAGAPASSWRPGDVRDLNFGGGLYRLTLESIAAGSGQAVFRLDALL
ncbi:MAG: hypothetical protein VKO44_06560 [Cyanobacteriota bacterium]|nr:hypothetical protein [Cyanobacteriota bacterium]